MFGMRHSPNLQTCNGSSSSSSSSTHGPREPLRPVTLLHDCRSFASWKWASTPVYNVVWPPLCRSSAWPVAVHHSEHHGLDESSSVSHSADVTKKFEFPLLYQVHYHPLSFCPLTYDFVADFVFPAYFQYTSVASHFKSKKLSSINCLYCPCFRCT